MSTPIVSISGKEFVSGTTPSRFMVRGMGLSATTTLSTNLAIDDILSNEHNAYFVSTILPKLVEMNVNVVRVYQVNPDNQHNLSMASLKENGIYAMVGLATSQYSVKQMTGDYDNATFVQGARVVDEFQAYDNTFCFSVGNEVEFPGQQAANVKIANPTFTDAQIISATVTLEYKVAQAMKSFSRDIKNHISANSYRAIPVGCAMQDGPQSSWSNENKVRLVNPTPYMCGLIGTDTVAEYYAAG